MRRVLLVTIDFPPMFGGVANYWSSLCRQLPANEIVVLASEYDDSLNFDIKQNYLVYRKNLLFKDTWLWPKWLPLLYWSWRLARQERIEKIIITHVLPAGTVALILKLLLRLPYVVSVHGLDMVRSQASPRKRWLVKKILQQAIGIIANSHYTKNLLRKLVNVNDQRVTVIYPCPNISHDGLSPTAIDAWRRQHQLADKKIILTTGRLIERKGQDKVLAAMPQIIKAVPEAVYLIVGNGKYKKDLEELTRRLALGDKVLFFSDITDEEMPLFYNLAEVFIMPCRCLSDGDVEGFGIVYLEANWFGKPVIAGRSGGAAEAVEHGVNGLLVDPLNTDEISQAVISLLTNEKLACELGERGRQRVRQQFNWLEQSKKLISLLSN